MEDITLMAVFDVTQQVVANSSGIISGNTRVNEVGLSMLEASMMQMEVGPLFGLFLQSFFIGISMRILSIIIFVLVYGRMIEIYMMVSLAPVPMVTWGNHEQSHIGQNYLKSLFDMMSMLKKIVLFPISLFVAFLALMARWLLTLSSYVVAPLMLYIFGCGIYTAYRQTWNQFFILLVAEFICFILFFGATAITEGIGRFSEWLAEL